MTDIPNLDKGEGSGMFFTHLIIICYKLDYSSSHSLIGAPQIENSVITPQREDFNMSDILNLDNSEASGMFYYYYYYYFSFELDYSSSHSLIGAPQIGNSVVTPQQEDFNMTDILNLDNGEASGMFNFLLLFQI